MSLYNEMRPSKLSDVKGQDNVVKILKENLISGHMPNALLFVGTRGVGKTTVARIVAKELNCEKPLPDGSCCDECPTCRAIKTGSYLDVLEMDAASNNGVDNIRDIIEKVQFKPIGKKKIIIMDEMHMLSAGAFNAMLKILEEPPKDVIFILCTTEIHKIPATILSRCRKFQFETISADMIMDKLKIINSIYNITAEEGALHLVAKAAKGSMRDAESIYENFLDAEDGVITEKMVMETLGFSNEEILFSIFKAIIDGDPTIAFGAIQDAIDKGDSLSFLLEECFRVLMDVITIHMGSDISTISANKDYLAMVSELAFSLSTERLFDIADAFRGAYEKKSGNMEIALQSMLISLVCRQSAISVLEKKVAALENEVNLLRKGVTSQSLSIENRECENYPLEDSDYDESTKEYDSTDFKEIPTSSEESALNLSVDRENHPKDDLSELIQAGFSVIDGDELCPDAISGQGSSGFSPEVHEEHPAEEDFFGDFVRQFEFDCWN